MNKQCKNRRQVAIENRKNSFDKHAPVNNSCFPLCSCFKTTHHFNSIPQNPRTICNEEVSKQPTTLTKSSSPACPTIDTMSSMKQPSQQPSIKKQLHFSIETQSDDAEKAKEEDDLDFKMKQRRRSSVAKVVKNVRRSSSLGSHESDEGSSSEDEEDLTNPRECKQANPNGFSDFCVKNIEHATKGRNEIKMAEREMPGVLALRKLYEDEKPLQGARIVCCTHVNAQTAVVIETLIQLGAKVRWASCNIYSTQNEVAAAVAHAGVSVYAWKGMHESDFWWCIDQCLEHDNWHPNLILDDGGDATDRLLNRFPSVFNGLKGVVEEGVSGIHRLHVLNKNDKLLAPAMRIDDAVVKCKFDTVYCCRETVVEVLKKAADVMFAGMKVLICGYGDVGKGCSLSLKSLGAQVFVTEVDPICALQACMEGYTVVQLEDVIDTVDCVITCTGNKHVLYGEHFNRMKSGCIVCNMGHPYMEVEIKTLKSINLTWQKVASLVDHVIWPDGKFIVLLSEGRLATLGNCKLPSLVASVTASTQILALIELFTAPPNLYEHDIYILPKKMDELVASLHLSKFNARLSVLTDEQSKYVGFDKKGPFKVKTYRY